MIRIKRLICFSLVLVFAASLPAMAIDTSSIDEGKLTYEDDANYMAEMLAACVDGSEEALLEGAKAEIKRNQKIETLGLSFDTTDFFVTGETAEEIAMAIGDYMVASHITTVDDEPVQYRIVASSLNVRTGPGTEYEKVGSLRYGTVITCLEREEDWVRVTDGEINGWCKDIYLAPYDGNGEYIGEGDTAPGDGTAAMIDYNEDDLYWLALAIQIEAGSNWLTDEHQLLVGNVIINRVASSSFPNSIYDVIHQSGQYPWAARGVKAEISDRAYSNAQRLLNGERFCPDTVVYQSTATQGSGVYTSIYDSTLGTTTYFCYV